MYNYLDSMKSDIKCFIEDYEGDRFEGLTGDELESELSDYLFTEDSVTGNGSGSYTFSRSTAKDYVISGSNLSLAVEMAKEFCCTDDLINRLENEDFEWIDVSIRCYLLDSAINEIIEDLENILNNK